MIAITGNVPTSLIGTDAFQEADIIGITRPITKHNYLVQDARDLPRIIDEAFQIATTGRPGPVLIDIPKDVALAELGPAAARLAEETQRPRIGDRSRTTRQPPSFPAKPRASWSASPRPSPKQSARCSTSAAA